MENIKKQNCIDPGGGMQRLVRKGMRLSRPASIHFQIRPEVHEWLCALSNELHCGVGVLTRGIVEDFYDVHSFLVSSEEVPGE